MPTLFSSLVALILLALPSFALACTPADPYDYPIRGAYLAVYLSLVVGLSLELFRLRVESAVVKRRLRLASFGFGLVLIVSLLLVSTLSTLRASWQESLPDLPAGATKIRC